MSPRVATAPLAAIATCFALLFAAPAMAAITEIPLPAGSQPTGIVTGPDGNLWVTESQGDKLARVTPAGVVTEFSVPANREPFDVTSAGGLLWFTERGGVRIGQINPLAGSDAAIQASIMEFVVPGTTSRPTEIVEGSDGNLWFTQPGSNEIGRITPAGIVFETGVPPSNSQPTGIAAGPDGKLWFTQHAASQIGRIPVAGVADALFPVPTLESAPSRPLSITVGPDGAMWFSDPGVDFVRRITLDGAVTGFSAPLGSGLGGITTGPDGALWLAAGRSGKILRATTGGAISEYTLPTANAGPAEITVGPDGALWFTERIAGQVGRITADSTPDVPSTGPQGPQGEPGPAGNIVLVAFQATPSGPRAGQRVTVRFVITDSAQVSLTVQRLGKSARAKPRTVASRNVKAAGIGKLVWNGKLGRKAAKPGRYRLSVVAEKDGQTATSTLRVRVRPRR